MFTKAHSDEFIDSFAAKLKELRPMKYMVWEHDEGDAVMIEASHHYFAAERYAEAKGVKEEDIVYVRPEQGNTYKIKVYPGPTFYAIEVP
jgi:hypothetical protein